MATWSFDSQAEGIHGEVERRLFEKIGEAVAPSAVAIQILKAESALAALNQSVMNEIS